MVFDKISTEKRAKRMLIGAYGNKKLPGAYVFSGQNADDMLYFAGEFARLLNCDNGGCLECLSCRKILNGTHPDFISVKPEGKKNIVTKDSIKEAKDLVKYGPSEGKYCIVCIESADNMEDAAANSFLKCLEEPPQNVIFILLTSRPEAIRKTILSRCQTVIFTGERRVTEEQVELFSGKDMLSLLDFSSKIAGPKREIEREEVLDKLSGLLEKFHSKKLARESGIVIDTIKNIKKTANVRLALDLMALKIGGHVN